MQPIKVSQVNSYIKRILGTDPVLSNLSVSGEISNFKYHTNGHIYFTLKDENAAVNCFLPSSVLGGLRFRLGDGLGVVCHGYINVYEKGGSYSLNIRDITVEGAGNLAAAFDLLKNKLREEGLFEPDHKKPLPFFPRTIGIVTSATGAAVEDMVKIITARNDYVNVLIYPSLVQGEGAAAQITAGIAYFNEFADDGNRRADVIIIGRGGGSAEDLWAFNEEAPARAVYASSVPVISAVGHETDVSITDFVADVRAETPTAAAALAAPDTHAIRGVMIDMRNSLMAGAAVAVARRRELTESRNPYRLKTAFLSGIEALRLRARAELMTLKNATKSKTTRLHHETDVLYERLNSINPKKIMALGYVAITGASGEPIRSVKSLKKGDDVHAYFSDGTAEMRVLDYNI
jgi:exodeoxyribonuclease VII large subunit